MTNWDKFREWYLPIREWEKSGVLYEWLGIRVFKYLVPTGGDFVRNRWGFRSDFAPVTKTTLEICLDTTKQCELVHVPFFVGYLFFLFFMPALVALGLNAVFNIYPIILQRYNRARIERILARYPAR